MTGFGLYLKVEYEPGDLILDHLCIARDISTSELAFGMSPRMFEKDTSASIIEEENPIGAGTAIYPATSKSCHVKERVPDMATILLRELLKTDGFNGALVKITQADFISTLIFKVFLNGPVLQ
jgi:hypothetical protein